MTTMLAARAHKGATELSLERIPVPEPGPEDVVIKVMSAGIAPGMMKLLQRGRFTHLPSIPGHEIAGVVVSAGVVVGAVFVMVIQGAPLQLSARRRDRRRDRCGWWGRR
ncbi:alcohol dehydrogenase catalytic domain-containing protein [uncultured Pigmentiphaga sp.]|uniref:alcohol dehydrogenase catalytic domain-containing protein n=1 Tax=uncultured Pigmentiphaga sp. TaxID=340361 RepID=UPI003447279D